MKRWFESVRSRPATARAYEKGKAFVSQAPTSEEARKNLFGKSAQTVRKHTPG